jgi:hypothetical protein
VFGTPQGLLSLAAGAGVVGKQIVSGVRSPASKTSLAKRVKTRHQVKAGNLLISKTLLAGVDIYFCIINVSCCRKMKTV